MATKFKITTKFKRASAANSAAIPATYAAISAAIPATHVATSTTIPETYAATSATLPETYAATSAALPETYAATYPTTYPTTYPDSSLATGAFSTVPGGPAVRRAQRCPHRTIGLRLGFSKTGERPLHR